MNVREVIEKRRSIRSFKAEDISKEIIVDILECGTFAPSAKNRQPWYFIVLKNEKKQQIADLLFNAAIQIDLEKYKERTGYACSLKYTSKTMKEASVLVLVYCRKSENWVEGDRLSLGACIENMCLRATSLDLGTLWIRDTNSIKKEIEKLYPVEDFFFNSALLIGYKNDNPKMPTRKDLKDIMEWYE